MADETPQPAAVRGAPQSPGGGRDSRGDERRETIDPDGTSGPLTGTKGERIVLIRAWLFIAVTSVVVTVVNSLTVLDDHPQVDRWAPWVWEGTSAFVILLFLWIPWTAWRLARPGPEMARPRFWLIHAVGLLAFSLVHVAGFTVLRNIAYAAIGREYGLEPLTKDFPYELRKDLLSYAIFLGIFWATERFLPARAANLPTTFDIRDGARLIRAPVAEIIAVSSAANYVEFHLADGRKPLMRAPLSALEAELSALGFVRTHRSWLVNTARVTGLKPAGSGDWTVELGAFEAPLSRRFREALEALKRA